MLRRCLAAAALVAAAASPSFAQSPSLSSTLFSFPGAYTMPGSARAASLALADRWLGDEPFDNPAAPPAREGMLAGAIVAISRQDLRGDNRDYDESGAFLDFAGARAAVGAGAFAFGLYVSQPVLRLEDNAFTAGIQPSSQPATVESHTAVREQRAGLSASFGSPRLRVGAAVEWTGRSDDYRVETTSGAPSSGTVETSFDGSAVGGQLGARARLGTGEPGTVELGAAYRFVPELAIDGEQNADLVLGTSTTTLAATRASSWEGGGAVRVTASPAFRVIASLGGHGAEEWKGFGVTRGAGSEWKLGGEYHDERDPWTFRFGGGFEEESGVPEPRASVLGVGGSWKMEDTSIDLGLTHRRLQRPGQPDSGDDRVVLGIVQKF